MSNHIPPPLTKTRESLIEWTLKDLSPREMAERLVDARETHAKLYNAANPHTVTCKHAWVKTGRCSGRCDKCGRTSDDILLPMSRPKAR